MEKKKDKSRAVLISAVFGIVNTLTAERSSETRPFRQLSIHLFRSHEFGKHLG